MTHRLLFKVLFNSALLTFSFPTHAQTDIQSFPLQEIQSPEAPKGLIFYITGDGGWNTFSKDLGAALAKKGFSVVALDSKKYFWDAHTPETFTSDLTFIINYYQGKLKIRDWILVGYSFGADVAPFALSRLNKLLIPKACVLLDPSASTDLEIKLADMLQFTDVVRKYSVTDEIQKTKCPTLCVYPLEEQRTAPTNQQSLVRIQKLPGDHRFNDNIPAVAESILSFISLF